MKFNKLLYNRLLDVNDNLFKELDVFLKPSEKYISELGALDSPFLRYSVDCFINGLKRNEIIRLNNLPVPLQFNVFESMEELISYYVAVKNNATEDEIIKYFELEYSYLLNTYLFSCMLGFVENIQGTKVSKGLYTTSAGIIKELSFGDRYLAYVESHNPDLRSSHIYSIVKLANSASKGKSATIPSKGLAAGSFKVVYPFYELSILGKYLFTLAKNAKVEVQFSKTNGFNRSIIFSLNPNEYVGYSPDFVKSGFQSIGVVLDKGYVRVVELGVSESDDATRAINLHRVESFKVTDTWDNSFIHVNLKEVLPAFISYVRAMPIDILRQIYPMITEKTVGMLEGETIRENLISHVNSMVSIGTTTYLKFLHTFMLNNYILFKGYSGQVVDDKDMSNFISNTAGNNAEVLSNDKSAKFQNIGITF